ncbi:low-specificity L-threonine aldolase [Arenimonas sp. MALMAid1274]|uniref:low-specificity L-threonine aldolase n=1 Tax=Arenimonas sp. MALMAid1274 TaxID=3411630 RepID=UPI003BA1A607
MTDWVDLRSDTVTRPTDAMREAGLRAPVGDDVFGDDPSVNALQDRLADDLGFEAGLFVPSGTQGNLLALMAHCQRGDEYLVGMDAHTYKYEGGGAAVLGSIQPQPIVQADDGTLPLDKVRGAIKPVGDPHFARTRLLALENTWHGHPLPLPYLAQAGALAREHGLAYHLDGARLFNAAVAGGVTAREIARHFDSVSVCLSKGLGAPVGSVLLGTQALVGEARRWRKVLGGGWRQAGLMAAMANHALDHHVARLADDHRRARALADGLRAIPSLRVETPETNLVFVTIPDGTGDALAERLARNDIRIAGRGPRLRLVTHLDIDDEGVARTVDVFADFFA